MRVAATALESYRLWRDQDWMSEADLIASLTHTAAPSRRMALGTAFGRVLEAPDAHAVPNGLGGVAYYEAEGYRFPADLMAGPLALYDRRGLCEVKATTVLDGVTLVAKADQLVGAEIIETKTTLGTYDPDKYAGSMQWRVMALVFEPVRIQYRVFSLTESPAGEISLRSTDTLNLYPYAGLADDVRALLGEFVDYVCLRGLTAHFADKVAA